MRTLGWPTGLGSLLAVVVMAAFGMLLERIVIRPDLGQPPFTVVMLTIGIGYVVRAAAGADLGHRDAHFPTRRSTTRCRRSAALSCRSRALAIIVGTRAPGRPAVRCSSASRKLGVAMQASSQNQLAAYYMGIPVKRVNG